MPFLETEEEAADIYEHIKKNKKDYTDAASEYDTASKYDTASEYDTAREYDIAREYDTAREYNTSMPLLKTEEEAAENSKYL